MVFKPQDGVETTEYPGVPPEIYRIGPQLIAVRSELVVEVFHCRRRRVILHESIRDISQELRDSLSIKPWLLSRSVSQVGITAVINLRRGMADLPGH